MSVNLGRGDARTAWEMSWERVLEVAREERRRRERGGGRHCGGFGSFGALGGLRGRRS